MRALLLVALLFCEEARVSITAGPNPLDAPVLDANTTYVVAGFAPGRRNYLMFDAQSTGEYEVYLGGQPVSVRVGEELPTSKATTKDCMHTVTTYIFEEGERYEIELGAIPAGARVLFRIAAPEEEEHVASRGPRVSPDVHRVSAR